MDYTHQIHQFKPIYNKDSELLILGTFPSVKSREQNFYYGHPQNRFWKVLAGIYKAETPNTIDEKKQFLLEHHIAVWDVIASCDIVGSSDNSIKNVIPNDIKDLLLKTNIKRIYANGNTAKKLYEKYVFSRTNVDIIGLPSTSPANAAFTLDKLILIWGEKIQKYI